MTAELDGASDDGTCASHEGAAAVGPCDRCGTFVCRVCRRHYDYRPLCGACYAILSHGAPASGRATWSLILAIVGFTLPILPIGLVGALLAHGELAAIEAGAAPAGGRGMSRAAIIFGWSATILFGALLSLVPVLLWALEVGPFG